MITHQHRADVLIKIHMLIPTYIGTGPMGYYMHWHRADGLINHYTYLYTCKANRVYTKQGHRAAQVHKDITGGSVHSPHLQCWLYYGVILAC